MDEDSPLLAQQLKIVKELANHFSMVYVITGSIGVFTPIPNVKVWCVRWNRSPRIISLGLIYFYLFRYLICSRGIVFTHMNDAFAALVAPILWITRTRHYLWYAHQNKSLFIRLAKTFLDGILSSTPGSCPYSGPRVYFIGQGIDFRDFPRIERHSPMPLNKGFHYGRFDPSKRIEVLFEEARMIRMENEAFTFCQIGGPSSDLYDNYFNAVKSTYRSEIANFIHITPFQQRDKLAQIIKSFDIFLHAYTGSLDKTLVETTLLEIPILTENEEYLNLFGVWKSSLSRRISDQYFALSSMRESEIKAELKKRRDYMVQHYSLTAWTHRLVEVLTHDR